MNGQGGPPMLQGPSPPLAPAASPGPPLVFDDRVVQLFRDDRMRGFVIDIETDSTIQPDEDIEKQRRVEFITAVGGFLKQVAELVPAMPTLTPMISEMLLFGVRGFRVGRSLEEVIERTMQQVQAQLTAAQANPPPDPKVEAEKAKMEMDGQRAQVEMQAEQQKMQAELQFKQAEMQQKLELEQQKMALEREKLEIEKEKTMIEMQLKQAEAQQKMQLETQKMQLDSELQQKEFEKKAAIAQDEARLKAETMQNEQEQMRSKSDQELAIARQQFDADSDMKRRQFGQQEKHADEAHKRKLSRDDAIAMHESQSRAGKPRQARGRHDGKPFEVVIE